MEFLNLIGGDYFTNHHSAGFDRQFATLSEDDFKKEMKGISPFVLLVTEINLYYDTERRNALATDQSEYHKWLAWRDSLFRKIPLSFYKRTTIKPDAWLLLCDIPSTEYEKTLIEELSRLDASVFTACADFRTAEKDYVRHHYLKPELIRRWVEKHVDPSRLERGIVTTRLDSDDALETTYFYDLHKFFFLANGASKRPVGDRILCNFPVGCQIAHNHAVSHIFGENCFTSLYEDLLSNKRLDTVWAFPHDRVPNDIPVANLITQTAAWFQGIHNRNVLNTKLDGFFAIRPEHLPQEFQGIYNGKEIST